MFERATRLKEDVADDRDVDARDAAELFSEW
jgi:hypothetical protein